MARARKTSTRAGGSAAWITRVLLAAGAVAALVFAVQGGEYGTRDLMRQSARRRALLRATDSLQRIIDSLEKYKRRVETDPALQERIAREEFGLVRGNKELLYRLAEPDTAMRAP